MASSVTIVQLLDHLPEAIVQRSGRVWNVFARSLGEQGADGRTALAWRWALTGACPSPVTLGTPLGRPPNRDELLTEASAAGELSAPGSEPGGQVMHARLCSSGWSANWTLSHCGTREPNGCTSPTGP